MSQIDWSATAAWIVLGANVLSPIVVALINNHHTRRMYILKEREAQRGEVINGYLSTLARAIASPNSSNLEAYSVRYGELSGYIPPDAREDVDKLNELVVRSCNNYVFGETQTEEMSTLYTAVRGHFYNALKP